MGHNVSAIAGVKSSNFYEQGNAINEIWVDNVELISRLPFGDSDLGQAGWPKGGWPKIPWHQFIIPLKRDMSQNITMLTRDVNPPTAERVCLCPIGYPTSGYVGMYKDWMSILGELFACTLLSIAIWTTAYVFFSLRWDRFCQDLEDLMPAHQKTVREPIDIPAQIRTQQQGERLIIRWSIRKFSLLGLSLLLVVFAFPATVVVLLNDGHWHDARSRLSWIGEWFTINLIAVILTSTGSCIIDIVTFFRVLRGRQMLETVQIVTIPVATIPGTDTWALAFLARETSDA